MEEKIKQLVEFVEEYGVDFLEDSAKAHIIDAIKNKNYETINSILNSIDSEFIKRAKEIKKFYIFNDYIVDGIGKKKKQLYYESGYMDLNANNESHIPVLKRCTVKKLSIPYKKSFDSKDER